MNAIFDIWMFACSFLFMLGMLLSVASPLPWVAKRNPRALMHGFLLALLAVAGAVAGAVLLS